MLIEKYTTKWGYDFLLIKQIIGNALSGIEHNMEHIGSTAVENLDSKPIIDIDIIYPNREDFDKIKLRLEKIGYYHNGNQGIEDRDVFKRKWKLFKSVLDTIKHHLYVCASNSSELQQHILFRDHLRKDEHARLTYQSIKYELAKEANQNKKKYAQLKEQKADKFISSIIEKEKRTRNIGFNKMES